MAAGSDLAGRVLQGRYRLLSTIGVGAGGRVYAADDTQLSRRIAVKVPHDALATDNGFLRRFRAEAQVAASLNHPNIVTLHDWGEDGLPFMVLELLSGGSLRSLLDSGVRLSPSQAASIGKQAASALAYAHARGLIHRDIKPANLLFDEHGTVRIADFGLARAMAEASWTEPSGAMLGTARYASPEQASGAPLDGRADMYALGLVLHEAVTGVVPGVADTTIGTLATRTQFSIPHSDELGPLSAVVECAGAADPDNRYSDATRMAEACADVASELPAPEPLTLTGIVAPRSDIDQTMMAPPPTPKVFDQDELSDIGPDHVPRPSAPRKTPTVSSGWAVPFVVLLLIVGTLLGAAFALAQNTEESVVAPRLSGLSSEQASVVARKAGFRVTVGQRSAWNDPAGIVIAQHPPAGAWVDGRTIRIDVSAGPAPIVVPAVAETELAPARAVLEQVGFVVVEGTRENSETIPKDTVIRQIPEAGARLAPESTVTIIVSDGPPVRTMPEVVNKTREEALAALTGAKLLGDASASEYSETVEKGSVIRADHNPGDQLPPGSTVAIVISKGSAYVQVPDVRGLAASAAKAKIEASELTASITFVSGSIDPSAPVVSQSPAPGSKLTRGSRVAISA